MTFEGRRLPDLPHGEIHTEIQPGDYWKILTHDGSEPLRATYASNLTGSCWFVVVPLVKANSLAKGYGLGKLMKHTVREHEDGTISVRPNDGSSNSILVTKGQDGPSWHGYIEHGVFRQC